MIDLADCFIDGPQLRRDIDSIEQNNEKFAEILRKISVATKKSIDAQRAAVYANRQMMEEFAAFGAVESVEADDLTISSLNRFIQVFKNVQTMQDQHLTEIENLVLNPIQRLCSVNLAEMRKMRTKFDADFQEYENELLKYCGLSKKKEAKGNTEDAYALINSLKASRKTFHFSSLSFCALLNELSSTKKLSFYESFAGLLASSLGFYSKSAKSLEDISPAITDLSESVKQTKAFLSHERSNEDSRINQLLDDGVLRFARNLSPGNGSLKRDLSVDSQMSSSSNLSSTSQDNSHSVADLEADTPKLPLVEMQGYLLKRSSGARKVWSRRYFFLNLSECRLEYLSPKETTIHTAAYLHTAQIREVDFDDRRFVFQIVSPTAVYHLQAENEGELLRWKNALLASAQHGPVVTEAPKLSQSSAQPLDIVLGLRKNASAKGSIEAIPEVPEENFILKSGELLFGKGLKTNTVSDLKSSSSDVSIANLTSDWKKVFALLTRDSNVVVIECESGKNGIPVLTKVLYSIDLNSLEHHAIQAIHESLIDKKASLRIQTQDAAILLSTPSNYERDDWLLMCNQRVHEKNRSSEQLRTAVSLTIGIHEARGLQASGEFSVEVNVDNFLLAVTSKQKTATPYWGEEFNFHDMGEINLGILLTLKQRVQKETLLGSCFISAETLQLSGQQEGWFSLVKGLPAGKFPSGASEKPEKGDKSDSQRYELKFHVRYQSFTMLHQEQYLELSNLLEEMEPDALFEIAKVAGHLETTAQNMLRIFLGKGIALSWLKKLVATEILQTDNINVMFRANSLATKAIDQYMKVMGLEYLDKTIGAVVRSICEAKLNCEVDPTRLVKGDDINHNWPRLITSVTHVWNQISKSKDEIPKEFRAIFSHIQKTATQKFVSEEARMPARYTTVSGFFFLRFFCPAVLTPKLFGLLPEHPDERTRRTLTLITKTLQSLANLGNFGDKEAFMQPMNEFLMDHTSNLMEFIDDASTCKEEPQHQSYPVDLEREFAEFQQMIISKKEAFENSKSPQIKALLRIVEKLEGRVDELVSAAEGF